MPAREITKLTLYGDSISGNCQKPRWTADYLDMIMTGLRSTF